MLEKLASPKGNYYGCEINIPETVLFEAGNMKKIIKTMEDGFVTTIKGPMIIEGPEDIMTIRKHLDTSAKERTRQQHKKYA